jgi:exonuclease III
LHFEEILVLVSEKKPKMLLLSETHVTNEINDSEIRIDGYTCIRCNSTSRHTGGVIIYVSKKISFKVSSNIGSPDHDYLLSINVIRGFKTGFYSVVYHSPASSHRNFLDSMQIWLENNMNVSKMNLIVGDFNIDMVKKDSYSARLLQLIEVFGMKQYINTDTRIENQHKSKIDPVISNDHVSNYNNISDHNSIYIDVNNGKNNEFVTKTIISWKNYSKVKLHDKLNEFDWDYIRNLDLETKANIFCYSLKTSVNELIQNKDIKIIPGKEWFSREINEMK